MNKREQDVLDQVRQRTADIKVPEKLEPDNIRRMLEEKEREKEKKENKKSRWGVRKTSALAAACAAAVIGIAAWKTSGAGGTADSRPGNWASGIDMQDEIQIDDSRMIAQAESYDQVYGYLEEYQRQLEREESVIKQEEQLYEAETGAADGGMTGEAKMMENTMEDRASTDSAPAEAAQDVSEGGGYSETNVRQEGVDEGDIVKTDGTYLYVLEDDGDKIAVVDSRNQDMKKAASIEVGSNCYIEEFYVVPDQKKLVAVCTRGGSDLLYSADPSYRGVGDSSAVVAVTYDIGDPTNPVEEGRVTQSGYYNSSRMSNGYLYLFSEYHIWSEVSQHEPREFIPLIGGDVMNAEDIYLPPITQANMYEVITAVDLKKPEKAKDSKAILSKGGSLYVSNQNIYFYEEEWGYSASGCVTTLRKVAYRDGQLKAKAQGQFDGYLKDSFCIDEYDGCLRVVVTKQDRVGGDSNAVYILDGELEQIGAIEGLAKDERIYSARFMGDTAYFVTFRETDPLFSADLSNPKKPKIVGELKIPGFSEYLHFYGEDRLLGIGMNVDEETLVTDGVKLTMFDISDKTDVKESDTHVLKNVYGTEVSYDYKAALISPERNIIGFPGDSEGGQKYFLFEYDEDDGFICNMEEKINGNGMRSSRGLYIEDTLYVVQGNIIEAYSLKEYEKVDDLIL